MTCASVPANGSHVRLARTLKQEGIALKEGDMLALGSFSMQSPRRSDKISVKYKGLPGNPVVEVGFD